MFGKGDDRPAVGTAHTLISEATELKGHIRFGGELIVEGRVEGNINAEDDSKAVIRVAESGRIDGDVSVPSAVINGVVKGDIRTTEHIELAAKASVTGTVYYNLIEMVMGAEINGNLMHVAPEQKRLAASPAQPQHDKDKPVAKEKAAARQH